MDKKRRYRLFVGELTQGGFKATGDVSSLREEIMLQDKILDFLKKKPDYVSGEEISEHLKISRQALWKHIQELKDLGYDVVAVPHLGYRLISSPDRLLPAEVSRGLKTKFIGKRICYFESISSTMDIALQLGKNLVFSQI
jgi:BirA family biotin operon repressor/biotin-[acetyl-CoA-carboxylase] ligase